MNRRCFLKGILAAAAAPAIVRADSLMRIVPRELEVLESGRPLITMQQVAYNDLAAWYVREMDRVLCDYWFGDAKLLVPCPPKTRTIIYDGPEMTRFVQEPDPLVRLR